MTNRRRKGFVNAVRRFFYEPDCPNIAMLRKLCENPEDWSTCEVTATYAYGGESVHYCFKNLKAGVFLFPDRLQYGFTKQMEELRFPHQTERAKDIIEDMVNRKILARMGGSTT